MDRPTITTLMATRYEGVIADLNIPEGSQTALNAAIDQAFRALGVLEADLPTAACSDSQVVDLIALAVYYTLDELLNHTPTGADIQAYTPAVMKKRSQIFAQLRLLRDDAARKASALGYTTVSSTGMEGWQMARVQLDYLEPDTEGF